MEQLRSLTPGELVAFAREVLAAGSAIRAGDGAGDADVKASVVEEEAAGAAVPGCRKLLIQV